MTVLLLLIIGSWYYFSTLLLQSLLLLHGYCHYCYLTKLWHLWHSWSIIVIIRMVNYYLRYCYRYSTARADDSTGKSVDGPHPASIASTRFAVAWSARKCVVQLVRDGIPHWIGWRQRKPHYRYPAALLWRGTGCRYPVIGELIRK